MDVLDRVRLGEDQQVVVALLVAGAADEALAAKVVLVELEPLDLRAHGAVEDQDALAGRLPAAPPGSRAPSRVAACRPNSCVEHGHTSLLPNATARQIT